MFPISKYLHLHLDLPCDLVHLKCRPPTLPTQPSVTASAAVDAPIPVLEKDKVGVHDSAMEINKASVEGIGPV
jgi:hypothetical protein